MDPITQGLLGSVGASQVSQKRNIRMAVVLGFLSGLVADLDVLIRSSTDPLLALEYHRQFTHSLFFIPIGGLLCASIFYWVFARKTLTFSQTFGFCTLGYATHALIDACTSYGTQLFWPFSDSRIAWNNISIVDPLFTIPILIFLTFSVLLKLRPLAMVSLVWAMSYLALGLVQKERAEVAGRHLAQKRGLNVSALEVKPSFANLFVWKIISTTDNRYYVDAVKVGWGPAIVFEGENIAKLDLSRDFPWLNPASIQALDVERFGHFSKGYLAVAPTQRDTIIDMRYSMLPNQITGLWGIRLSPDLADSQHVQYVELGDRQVNNFSRLWQMITAGESKLR